MFADWWRMLRGSSLPWGFGTGARIGLYLSLSELELNCKNAIGPTSVMRIIIGLVRTYF